MMKAPTMQASSPNTTEKGTLVAEAAAPTHNGDDGELRLERIVTGEENANLLENCIIYDRPRTSHKKHKEDAHI